MSRRRQHAIAMLTGLAILLIAPLAFAEAHEAASTDTEAARQIWGIALGAGLAIVLTLLLRGRRAPGAGRRRAGGR